MTKRLVGTEASNAAIYSFLRGDNVTVSNDVHLSPSGAAVGISRRSLLRGAAATAAGAALPLSLSISSAAAASSERPLLMSDQAEPPKRVRPIRGVNLGSWLVLEKWIAPSAFQGVRAGDEYGLCAELGPDKARAKLQKHRDTFITEADFAHLASIGINAVRLPVGYWVLGGEPPFVDGKETLDNAFAWAHKHGLKVMLDLHGAPGSQNGNDHSGRSGPIEWAKPENMAHTHRVLEHLAETYKDAPALYAIELLNEPGWAIPIPTLKTFYAEAYHRLRKFVPADRVAIAFHDGFRSMEWGNYMNTPEYENVILDTHQYQCFTNEDRKRSPAKQIELASAGRSAQIAGIQKQLPTCVGEWSLGLPGESMAGLSRVGRDAVSRAYAGAQLLSYDQANAGYFFWTYKTETSAEWSLMESIRRGWMPERYS